VQAEYNKSRYETSSAPANGNGLVALTKELWQAAVNLRGSVEPADYKRYVLPIIFLRFLSLRYEKRRAELERAIKEPDSEYFGDKRALVDPDEYRSAGAFIIPEAARWDNIRKVAQADDIKIRLDNILDLLENTYPDKLKGLLPRIYAGSNLERENVTGLINLFSKDIFKQDHDGQDLIGRVTDDSRQLARNRQCQLIRLCFAPMPFGVCFSARSAWTMFGVCWKLAL
jgi:type I restriction-modification system DNA methylase subunit